MLHDILVHSERQKAVVWSSRKAYNYQQLLNRQPFVNKEHITHQSKHIIGKHQHGR